MTTLENMFAATAFAEAGEFDTARMLLKLEEIRSILLVLDEEEAPPTLFVTALSMMERLEAGVEILIAGQGVGPSSSLSHFLDDVARNGKKSRLIHRPRITWEMVVAHAGSLSDIVCILVESLEKWGLKGGPGLRRPPPWSRHLPCPLVVAAARPCSLN